MVDYTRAEQAQLADEIAALPADAVMIPRAIADYAGMREQGRTCRDNE